MSKKIKSPKNETLFTQLWARFLLPRHDSAVWLGKENLHHYNYVAGDIYCFPEITINLSPAVPLNEGEQTAKWKTICKTTGFESVADASASAEKGLADLAVRARAGDGKALWELARLLDGAVRGLYEMVNKNPNAAKPLARNLTHWPMPRSRHPKLCGEDSLLERIELGKAAGRSLDKHSKWIGDWAAVYAGKLINHVESIRGQNPVIIIDGKKIPFSEHVPPFDKDSAEQWWGLAQKFLLSSYPRPEEVSELDRLVTTASKRKYPSTRRVAILEKIKARFVAMACQT